ncbi:cell division cycle and apoptosis regulator protein [Salix suchowensis]|nr:cell division cycle and apoptosis regulator protein [Salix suchowensis]
MTGNLGSGSSSSSNRPAIMGSSGTPNTLSTPNQQPRIVGGFKCFNCGEVGHCQLDCKRLGKRTLFTETNEEHNDDTVITGEPLFDEDDEVIEDWVEGDVGPLLMVRPIYDEVAKAVTLKNNVLMADDSSQEDMDCTSRSTFLHPGGDDAASTLALEYLERKDRCKTGK